MAARVAADGTVCSPVEFEAMYEYMRDEMHRAGSRRQAAK
jgi:hypothetical protein